MKCTEAEEEEVTKGRENQLQLSCFINQEVKYLFTGLKLVSYCGIFIQAAFASLYLREFILVHKEETDLIMKFKIVGLS